MRRILLILMLAIVAVGAKAQTPSPDVDKLNASCPVSISEWLTLTSATVEDNTLILLFTVADEMYAPLESMKDSLRDTIMATLKSSPDESMNEIASYCKKSGFGFVQRYTSGNGDSFDIHISADDLK